MPATEFTRIDGYREYLESRLNRKFPNPLRVPYMVPYLSAAVVLLALCLIYGLWPQPPGIYFFFIFPVKVAAGAIIVLSYRRMSRACATVSTWRYTGVAFELLPLTVAGRRDLRRNEVRARMGPDVLTYVEGKWVTFRRITRFDRIVDLGFLMIFVVPQQPHTLVLVLLGTVLFLELVVYALKDRQRTKIKDELHPMVATSLHIQRNKDLVTAINGSARKYHQWCATNDLTPYPFGPS